MRIRANKYKEYKSQLGSKTEFLMPKGGKSSSSFVDKRPEAVAQRKLQDMASDSANSMQFKVFDDMVANSQRSKQVAQLNPKKIKHKRAANKRKDKRIEKTNEFIKKSKDNKQGIVGKTDESMYSNSLKLTPAEQPNKALGVSEDTTLLETNNMNPEDIATQVNQLMKNAAIASNDLQAFISGVIKAVPEAKNGDPGFKHINKSTKGAIEKAQDRMDGKTTASLNDVLRGTIVCDNEEILANVQKYLENASLTLLKQTGGAKTQKKNAFDQKVEKLVGYGDIKYMMPVVHYKSENQVDFWMYCELQVMLSSMKKKKEEGGHYFYDLTREAKEEYGPMKKSDQYGKKGGKKMFLIEPKDSSKAGAKMLLYKYPKLLKKGVNKENLSSVLEKLKSLKNGNAIHLTSEEKNELEFSGELVYKEERLNANLSAHYAKRKSDPDAWNKMNFLNGLKKQR